jgi:exodeoxyribonuclease VII small subunit
MDAAQNYEQALKELEEIVGALEKGDIPLEKSLELFQRGVELTKYCTGKLDETEKQILKIVEEDGVSSEVPWEPEAQK